MICHIARGEEWEAAEEEEAGGEYKPAQLEEDGFIHCSMPKQVEQIANERFAGEEGLVLLWIAPAKVKAGVLYERPKGQETGELYPHVHGPLNVDAVVKVNKLKPWQKGGFVLPPEPPLE